MKKRAGLCIGLILLGVTLLIPSEEGRDLAPAQKWVARYNGPGNGVDRAWAMALDKSGNVYITGESAKTADLGSSSDFATVKYSTAGKRLWVQRYGEPYDYYSAFARAIAVDGSGNAYVAGETYDSSGSRITTIKYSATGKQLWVKRFNEQDGSFDEAYAIAVDGSGNVYVTGRSGDAPAASCVTIKYDTNGKQLWAKWNGGQALAVDGSGNVYVAGTSNKDYIAIKYNTNGKQLWAKKYNGPANLYDSAKAIAVDKSGNVYITGESTGSKWDYATIKYSPAGKQLWVQGYNGPADGDDRAKAIAVDKFGNVTITGNSKNSGTDYDMATIKYDTSGEQIWVQRYDGPGNADDEAAAIAVDASGNIYVTGTSEVLFNDNDPGAANYYCNYLTTIKYGSNGKQVWAKKYKWPGGACEYATDIAIDKSGNVYVSGESKSSTTDWDYIAIKY